MSKRPAINLADLTAEAAAPMTEAAQRAARPAAAPTAAPAAADFPVAEGAPPVARRSTHAAIKTADLKPLAFKVPPAFRKRFKQRAMTADLKLNQLLFEALDAWEEKKGLKR